MLSAKLPRLASYKGEGGSSEASLGVVGFPLGRRLKLRNIGSPST
jgi:hypothetical protein